MIRKTGKYAMMVAMVLAPMATYYAADSNGLVYDDQQRFSAESNPVTLAAQDDSNGSLVRVVRRGTPPPMQDPAKLPVKVDADSMYYGDTSGTVVAVGAVDIVQGNREVHSDKLVGNVKSKDYTTEGPFHYLEDKGATKDLRGNNLQFNTGTRAVTVPEVEGWVAPYFIKAEKAEYDGDKGLITNGWLTTKHAMAYKGVPDYRMEGSLIEVYPGDKAIIHNARLFIKNGEVLSRSRYVVSLRSDKEGKFSIFSLIPRPMYNGTDGFGLRGNIKYPVGDNSELFLNYQWYTKSGMKPSFGYRYYLPIGVFTAGYSRDSSSLNAKTVWVEKRPEISFYSNQYHFGNSPITYRGGANIGYWKEDYMSGSHSMIFGEISHDPYKFAGDNGNVRLYTGYQRDTYGYNDHTRSMPYWGINTQYKVNNRLNLWAGYRQNNLAAGEDSPYPFDTVEIHRNLSMGASLRLTNLDTFIINTQRDVQTGELRYVDYTWYRDMHSFTGSLTYRSKQKTWEYTIMAKDF